MLEWTQPGRLVSPYGELAINAPANVAARILVDKTRCSVVRGLRAPKDSVPQGDGAVLHRRFADGTELRFNVTFWEYETPACRSAARAMSESLAKHLQAILNGAGRYYWQPSGTDPDTDDDFDERFLDEARWLVELTTDWSGEYPVCSFAIDSPFPYFISSTQNLIEVADGGGGVTVDNKGNAEQKPVIIVAGPATAFTIENQTTGLTIVYDSSQAGAIDIDAGDIGEFDTFADKAYLGEGGEPGDDASLKAGVDPETTDYFGLVPGDNLVVADGADITIKQNHAWVPH